MDVPSNSTICIYHGIGGDDTPVTLTSMNTLIMESVYELVMWISLNDVRISQVTPPFTDAPKMGSLCEWVINGHTRMIHRCPKKLNHPQIFQHKGLGLSGSSVDGSG